MKDLAPLNTATSNHQAPARSSTSPLAISYLQQVINDRHLRISALSASRADNSVHEDFTNWDKEATHDWEIPVPVTIDPLYVDAAYDWSSTPFVPKSSPRYVTRGDVPKALQKRVQVKSNRCFPVSNVGWDVICRECRSFGATGQHNNLLVRQAIHDTTGSVYKIRDPRGHHITLNVYGDENVDQEGNFDAVHLYVCRFVDGGPNKEKLPAGDIDDSYPYLDEIGLDWDSWGESDTPPASPAVIKEGILEMCLELKLLGMERALSDMDSLALSLFREEICFPRKFIEVVETGVGTEVIEDEQSLDFLEMPRPARIVAKRRLVRERRESKDVVFFFCAMAVEDGLGGLAIRGWRCSVRFTL